MGEKEIAKMALVAVDKPNDSSTHVKLQQRILDEDAYLEVCWNQHYTKVKC